MTMQDVLLSLSNIRKNFGEGDVLAGISLDVLREQARLLASFLASVGEDWEEKLCF